MKQTQRASFGSMLGIILATAGSAVGLGNIWRFPYMTGQNGGAAFILIYIACVIFLAIPCMVSEFIIGRRGQANAVRSYDKIAGGGPWKLIGLMGVLTGFLICSFYSVVSGWCLEYIYASAAGHLQGDPEYTKTFFNNFVSNPWIPAVWVVVFLLATHFIIVRGVEKGIEKASKFMMPVLFVLLLVIVVASCMLPGASKGISFLLKPDWQTVNSSVLLGALGQAFFSLSLGMGALVTYASYFNRRTNLTKSAGQIALIDTLVAILSGLMIFPAAFAVGVSPDSGPSLVFITLPNVFQEAFGAMPVVGYVIAILFYALLALAALTSIISLHEVCTSYLHEEFHISRSRGASIVTAVCIVLGIVCSLSLGAYEGIQLFGMSLFDFFDYTTSQIFMPIGGFLTCILMGWFVPKRIVKAEFTNDGTLSAKLFGIYLFLVRYVCPVGILCIFLNQYGVL
jgi:NSS family neurotransmitter:Na+ symporter